MPWETYTRDRPVLALTFLSTAKEQTALIRGPPLTLRAREPRVSGLFLRHLRLFAGAYDRLLVARDLRSGLPPLPRGCRPSRSAAPDRRGPRRPGAPREHLLQPRQRPDRLPRRQRSGSGRGSARHWPSRSSRWVCPSCWTRSGGWWRPERRHGRSRGGRVASMRRFMRLRVPAGGPARGLPQAPGAIRFGLKLAPGGSRPARAASSGGWVLGATGTVAQVVPTGPSMLSSRLLIANTRIGEMLLPTLDWSAASSVTPRASTARSATRCATPWRPCSARCGGRRRCPWGHGGVRAGIRRARTHWRSCCSCPPWPPSRAFRDRPCWRPWAAGTSTWISVARAAITLVLTIPLTAWLGATGAALGLVVGAVLVLPVTIRTARRHVSAPISRWCGPRDLLAVASAYGAAAFLRPAPWTGRWPHSGTAVALIAEQRRLRPTAFVLAGGVRPRDRERLRDVIASLTRRAPLPNLEAR